MTLNSLLVTVVDFYSLAVFVRVIFSWLPPRHRLNVFYQYVAVITDPVLKPARRLIPPMSGIDFSPILVFLALRLLREAIA